MKPISVQSILKIANDHGFPIFRSNRKFNYNLNIWGFRSSDKNTEVFNDLAVIFYENKFGGWIANWFDITTDPSNLTLMNPVNIDGTAILCEGHHSKLWTFGYHKQRHDHPALVQHSACKVYRDNNRDDKIDSNLPVESGIFGINMHRASAYGVTPKIGLYSAGCQVHSNIDKYNKVFLPLIRESVNEGNSLFSYTLCLESWM